MRRRRMAALAALMLSASVWAMLVQSASMYANPAFETQWRAGEAITPNFWGPLANAKDGRMEPYGGAMRLVQYFDKGRMELTGGAVTNGLLASEIIKGQIQTGDATFEARAPAAIPVAGDPDSPGPTYAGLSARAMPLFAATPRQMGGVTARVAADGAVTMGSAGSGPTGLTAYDSPTMHNVPQAFADYRTRAGVAAIGLAISEPFFATVKVGGQMREVVIQVFERRVLTYTASNPEAFRVEMGNIGLHYFQWRYETTSPQPTTSSQPMPTAASGTAQATGGASVGMGQVILTPGATPTTPSDIASGGPQSTALVSTITTVNTAGKTPGAICRLGPDGRMFVCK